MASSFLWASIAPARAHEILLSVNENNKKLYKTALELLSPHMGLRTVRILEMPKKERHAIWQKLLSHPSFDPLGFNLFTTWLVASQSPLLVTWLDALGISHDGRGCTESFPPCPPETMLRSGIDKLLAQYDPEIVSVYLRIFNEIEDVQWAPLKQLIEAEPRLKLNLQSQNAESV